jgi:hypothetical protein
MSIGAVSGTSVYSNPLNTTTSSQSNKTAGYDPDHDGDTDTPGVPDKDAGSTGATSAANANSTTQNKTLNILA